MSNPHEGNLKNSIDICEMERDRFLRLNENTRQGNLWGFNGPVHLEVRGGHIYLIPDKTA